MSRKEKEEERIERIIRGLLKLPENRRCINCNSLGPQYVCTTFLTFVCTNCSGIHREFTHRVKSVSMAKFKAEEVSALQAGGNERARQLYFKEWDPQRNSYPDGSNLHRLRDFIKHVYVDRKYSGERSHERLPKLRLSDKEESHENRKLGSYYGSSRSPNYEFKFDRRRSSHGSLSDEKSIKYYYDERRSPRYAQENSRYGGFKRSPVRFEVVDDRFRDDRTQGGRESANRRFSQRDVRFGSLSPDHKHNMDSSSPVSRPVKDITGQNAPALQVGESSKATVKKNADGSAHNEVVASSGSKRSIDEKTVEEKNQNLESLINFDSDPMPSNAEAGPKAQENHQLNDGGNHKSNGSSTKQNASQVPKRNTLEFLLFELSVPSDETSASVSEDSNHDNPASTTSGGNMSMSSGVSAAAPPGLMLALTENSRGSTNTPGGSVPFDVVSPAAVPGQKLALSSSAGTFAITSGGNMPNGNVSAPPPPGLMLTLPENIGGSTNVHKRSLPFDVVSLAAPPGQMLALSSSASPSAITSGGNIPNGNVSATVPVGQISASSNSIVPFRNTYGESMPAGGLSSATPAEQTLSLFDTFDSTTPSTTSLPMQPSDRAPSKVAPDIHGNSFFKVPNGQQVPSMRQHQLSSSDCRSNGQPSSTTKVVDLNNQLWTSLNVPNAQAPFSASAGFSTHDITKVNQDSNFGIKSQQLPLETKSIGRTELPADLFTASYLPVSGSIPGWQNAPPYGTGFGMQYYPNAVPVLPYPNQGKSSNPFDLNNESTSVQVSPAMPANLSVPGNVLPATGIDTISSGLMATQAPSYTSAMPLQSSSFASPTSGAYTGQLHMNTQSSRSHVAAGGYGTDAHFGSLNMIQQSSSCYPQPSAPNSLPPMGGNPFG